MDRHLKEKLHQYDATPPEGVWTKIEDALDAEENFSRRLFEYEEAPPAAAWQEIEKNLDQTAPVKVVPFQRSFRKPMRFAAVAVFLSILLVAVTLLVRRTEAGALDNTTTNTALGTPPPIDKPTIEQTDDISIIQPTNNTSTSQTNSTGLPDKQPDVSVENITSRKKSPVYSSLSDYVVFSDGDGKVRKVSRKLAGFVNCKDNDLPCKQRLRELRQQMAAKAMTTDFTGVLELLRHMQ